MAPDAFGRMSLVTFGLFASLSSPNVGVSQAVRLKSPEGELHHSLPTIISLRELPDGRVLVSDKASNGVWVADFERNRVDLVRLGDQNSALFQALGLLHPRFRTVMLVRELLNKRRRHVTVRVGKVIAAQKLIGIPTDRERIDYLRWRTYLLASRHEYKPRTSWPLSARWPRATVPAAIAAATSPDLMQADVSQLPEANLLARSGEMNAYIAPACS